MGASPCVKRAVVTPGETVAYAEEYDVRGSAYYAGYKYIACTLGVALYDDKSHTAVVRPVRNLPLPQPGAVVYCQVTGKGKRAYQLKCFAVEGKRGPVDLKYQFTGILPHFLADGRLGIGDYIRARVVSAHGPPLIVSIRGPTYGVILSRCPKCGSTLKRHGMALVCPSCAAEAARKIAVGYYASFF